MTQLGHTGGQDRTEVRSKNKYRTRRELDAGQHGRQVEVVATCITVAGWSAMQDKLGQRGKKHIVMVCRKEQQPEA